MRPAFESLSPVALRIFRSIGYSTSYWWGSICPKLVSVIWNIHDWVSDPDPLNCFTYWLESGKIPRSELTKRWKEKDILRVQNKRGTNHWQSVNFINNILFADFYQKLDKRRTMNREQDTFTTDEVENIIKKWKKTILTVTILFWKKTGKNNYFSQKVMDRK